MEVRRSVCSQVVCVIFHKVTRHSSKLLSGNRTEERRGLLNCLFSSSSKYCDSDMGLVHLDHEWAPKSSVELVLGAILALLVGKTALFLWGGVQIRMRFRQMRAQGIVSNERQLYLLHCKMVKMNYVSGSTYSRASASHYIIVCLLTDISHSYSQLSNLTLSSGVI